MGQSAYLCESWQGLIQQLQSVISSRYYYYQEIKPAKALNPEKRKRIDERLITKFNTDTGKDKRYCNKKKRIANYVYLRFEDVAYVLHSVGSQPDELNSEVFADVREIPLIINIGIELQLKISRSIAGRSFTVYLSNECFRDKKAVMLELLEHRNMKELEFRFQILNGIPAYAGINSQKKQLKDCLFKFAKKNGVVLAKDKFRISFKRKIYKVFSNAIGD